jgi:hypothetical protein
MYLDRNAIFWAAFWAGLAGPVALYDPPPEYPLYLNNINLASNFGAVGWYLDYECGGYLNVGEPSAGDPASS